MYFTVTPSLNSVEAIMKRPPGVSQRGGGKNRSPYRYTKDDCDCRLCLHYRKKNGCTAEICPVLDIRLGCGGASLSEAVKSAFAGARHIPFQRRLSKLYDRKDVEHMIFQSNRHKQIFEAGRLNLHRASNQALAALYLLTTDHTLWIRTKRHIASSGKVELKSVHLGDISTDGYALWKAVKELQTGERQVSLCELSDGAVISDRVFRLIVQAVAIARFGAAVLNGSEVRHD